MKNKLKFFFLVPLITLSILYHLFTSDIWYYTLFAGIILYFPIQQLGQSSGYHKLFAHRAFKPVLWYPYFASFLASISFFGDPLGSAMVHRIHHKYSDSDKDPHSPLKGRYHAYVGWTLTWKPDIKDVKIITDVIRDYPWVLSFHKYEFVLPWLFHGLMFIFAGWFYYPIALACVLSINNGMFVNAFSHKKDKAEAIDSIILAKYINPIFLHKRHHDDGKGYDYSYESVNDFWGKIIRKFLTKE